MKVVKVTSKGQVTIPIEARQRLGIDESSYLEVSLEADAVTFRKRRAVKPLSDGDPVWDLVGEGSSGSADVSREHDRYLAEAEHGRWRKSS